MGQLINTSDLSAKNMALMDQDEKHWIYNGFDCMLTDEILGAIEPMLDPHSQLIYNFERAMQGPALDMMLRGIKIDGFKRDELFKVLQVEGVRMERYLSTLAQVFGLEHLNANSHKQLKYFFYDVLALPEQTIFDKGTVRVSVNKEALDKLTDYQRAKPFVHAITAIRDIVQQLSVLKTSIRNGRMYTSLNIGKETGRWSSSASAFDDGRGLQNIMEILRVIFIPDKGMKLGYADLQQAESNTAAHLAEDLEYIEAHATGNVHKLVCSMIFPEVKDPRGEIIFGHWTYYDLCKRASHMSNYFAKPPGLAKALKVPVDVAELFQARYFGRFRRLREWQYEVISRLQLESQTITPTGRRRIFFGRTSDETTQREAIANDPQSIVADLLNMGMYRVWKTVSPLGLQLLLPVHDAIFFQYPEEKEEEICNEVKRVMPVPLEIHGRVMSLGLDIAVGYNWSKFNDNPKKGPINLSGLVELGSPDVKKQKRTDTPTALLARRIS